MSSSKVFMFDAEDPEMVAATERARATFRYLWREMTWEYRRIVPALSVAAVKAPFFDKEDGGTNGNAPYVEQMWFSEIFFDGQYVSGVLLNTPNHLTSVTEGDSVKVPLQGISDWMYAIGDNVFGAFTVQVMRLRMNPKDRREHDAAWGLNFGDPAKVRVVSDNKQIEGEHPMSQNMAPSLIDQLNKNRAAMMAPDEEGWTTLHSLCLGGSYDGVKILLDHGADPNQKTGNGLNCLQLARSLGWDKVATLLLSKGAKEA